MKGSKRSLGVVGATNGCDFSSVGSSVKPSGEVVKGSKLLLGLAEGNDGSEFKGVDVSSVGASVGAVKGSRLSLGAGLEEGV
jgi:hypothetical protein